MNPFEFVIAIVILVILYKIVTASLESKRESRQEKSAEPEVDGLQRLEALEERVRVLERIVTDEQFELRQRFKSL